MSKDTITIDGTTYIRADLAPEPSPIKIIICQRGWIYVGHVTMSDDGERYIITDASVIRTWGTTKGLGEIALGGPTSNTVLDKAGRVEVQKLTTVALLDCVPEKWASL